MYIQKTRTCFPDGAITTEANKEIENIKQDLAELRKDIKGLSSALKNLGKQKVDETTEKIEEKKDDLLDSFSLAEIKERLDELKGEGEDAVAVIRQQAEKNPVGTLLTAMGVGLLLGRLLSSGNR
jgi:ElaB/YqjD/DUF883 family membrane-anchored ribosome-binding protein